MATVTVRSTYSLDLDTVQRLEALAKLWNTSKSGALRRAIKEASVQANPGGNAKLKALKQLQEMLALDAESAAQWHAEMRREREGSSEHRMSRLLR